MLKEETEEEDRGESSECVMGRQRSVQMMTVMIGNRTV